MWLAFVDLAGTRDVGFAVGPISYREIDAYQRQSHAQLSAWDVALIRRMDIAVRAVISGSASQTDKTGTDVGSMKATLRAAAARLAKRTGEPDV